MNPDDLLVGSANERYEMPVAGKAALPTDRPIYVRPAFRLDPAPHSYSEEVASTLERGALRIHRWIRRRARRFRLRVRVRHVALAVACVLILAAAIWAQAWTAAHDLPSVGR